MKYLPINLPYAHFAQAEYSCGTYGAGNYGEVCATEQPDDGGGLAGTGYDILLPVFLGIAILLASGVLLIKRWRRKKNKVNA